MPSLSGVAKSPGVFPPIDDLPSATTPLSGSEFAPISQGGVDKKVTVDNLTTGKSVSVSTLVSGAGTALLPALTTTGDLNTGAWFPAADTFAVSTGGSERLRVTSAGAILFGSSLLRTVQASPFIQIEGANDNAKRYISLVYNVANANAGGLQLSKSRASTNGGTSVVQSNDDLGQIGFFGADGTNLIHAATILAQVDGTPGTNDMPGRLVFSTTADGASSPTERMRITSAGYLLIGATGTRVVDVAVMGSGGGNVIQTLQETTGVTGFGSISNGANSRGSLFSLGKTRGTVVGAVTSVISGDVLGAISFNGADGTGLINAATIMASVDGNPGTNDMPGRLVFSTTADGGITPTERMRINSAGNVGIGKTNPAASLDIGGTGTVRIAGATASTGTNLIIDVNGDIRPETSSSRFKTNIATTNIDTSRVMLLKLKKFNYLTPQIMRTQSTVDENGVVVSTEEVKVATESTISIPIGVIAEEVYDVFPELVNLDSNGAPYSINHSILIYSILAEIKKMKKKVEEHQRKLDLLG